MISLQLVDAEFTGLGSDWPRVIGELFKKKLVSWQNVYNAEILWGFGCFINNTDMHLGNLGLSIDGNVFRLLPVYDMCSMGFAPKRSGEVLPYNFTLPEFRHVNLPQKNVSTIKEIAHDFWERVTNDEQISEEFKEFLGSGNPIDLKE